MAKRRTRGAAAALTKASFKAAGKRIETLAQQTGKAVPSGLRLIGEEIMLDVKASRPGEGVPVDTGALRSSGRVEGPKLNAVTLSFGGAAAPYAIKVHEELDTPHTVGEARYLVRGLERWRRDGASVRRALKHLQVAVDKVIAARVGRRK